MASIKRADIEALSTSRLYFFAADSLDLGKDRVGADTAALHIIRVGSASDSVVYGIIVTGRPFAFNYVAMVVLRRSGNRWIAMTPSYFVE